MQGHDGRAPGLLKGGSQMCCVTHTTKLRFVLWQLSRQTLPAVQNFHSSMTCSALSNACEFRQY